MPLSTPVSVNSNCFYRYNGNLYEVRVVDKWTVPDSDVVLFKVCRIRICVDPSKSLTQCSPSGPEAHRRLLGPSVHPVG